MTATANVGSVVQLVIRAGSAYDPPSREGLAYALASGSAAEAGVEVSVGPELVVFTATSAEQVAALARVLGSTVTEGRAESGRRGALAALASVRCADVARSAAAAWVHVGHPYGHAVAGRLSVVPTLSTGELEGFRASRYVRDAAVIVPSAVLDATPLVESLAPALSALVTPAVRSAVPREDLIVVAPVAEGCGAVAPRRLTSWSPRDEAAFEVAASLLGGESPPALVDALPVLVVAPTVSFAGAVRESPEKLAADVLLSSIRGGTFASSLAVARAAASLSPETAEGTMRTFGPDAVHIYIVPDEAAAAVLVESHPGLRVLPYEELLR